MSDESLVYGEATLRDPFVAAFLPALDTALTALEIELAPAARVVCAVFCRSVRDANAEGLNLTRIVAPEEMAVKHVADSLTVLKAVPSWREGSPRIADVGTGAGFPGVPLLYACPGIRLNLIDSLRKRLDFLDQAVEVTCTRTHRRAEDAGREAGLRESFDGVVARAVAPLPVLLEWCAPLVTVGGVFVAMLGAKEPEAGEPGTLGLTLEDERVFTLPDAEQAQRRLRVYRKVRATPARYPRRPAEIRERPLGGAGQ